MLSRNISITSTQEKLQGVNENNERKKMGMSKDQTGEWMALDLLSSTFGVTSAQKWQMGKIMLSRNIPITSAPTFLPGIYAEYNKWFFWNHNIQM